MNIEHRDMVELIVKYLLGEADAQEHLTLNNWREEREEHEQYFRQFEFIWAESKKLKHPKDIDENEAWTRLQSRISNTKKDVVESKKIIGLNWRSVLKIAALIVVLLGGSLLIYQQQSSRIISLDTANQVRTETLPDGSLVTLNKNAHFEYPKNFSGDTRKVLLVGEAFFNISPNKEKPFIIDANGVQVKVVGTSFNVKTNAQKTEVIVETGIVEVSKNENSIRLKPQEKAIVNASGSALKQNASDRLYNYYRSNEFECINIPLWRVVEALNEAYGSQIVIDNPNIKDLRFRTNLINQSLDDNLLIIAETLDIQIEKNGNKILLK